MRDGKMTYVKRAVSMGKSSGSREEKGEGERNIRGREGGVSNCRPACILVIRVCVRDHSIILRYIIVILSTFLFSCFINRLRTSDGFEREATLPP